MPTRCWLWCWVLDEVCKKDEVITANHKPGTKKPELALFSPPSSPWCSLRVCSMRCMVAGNRGSISRAVASAVGLRYPQRLRKAFGGTLQRMTAYQGPLGINQPHMQNIHAYCRVAPYFPLAF